MPFYWSSRNYEHMRNDELIKNDYIKNGQYGFVAKNDDITITVA